MMNIYHIVVRMWDGDDWHITHEAVIVDKSGEAARAHFHWAGKEKNVEVLLIGKATSNVEEGVILEINDYQLERIIEAKPIDRRALVRASMLDLFRTKGESMAEKKDKPTRYSEQELEEMTKKVLATFTPTEKQILAMRFGIKEVDPKEVPKRFSEIREKLKEIESKALRAVRRSKKLPLEE